MVGGAGVGLVKKQEPPAPTVRIRYNKRLEKLLRTFGDRSYILLDNEEGIRFVLNTEIERI